ncbi:MAG: endopeptidase La [Bacteroidales bacterium]|nr:endopeptidase La [Bacteroidales bacterium]MCM1147912.1 endopeptidase La [Bacteroidales bacterium]MCM1205461.1 endopeptidase La [Bacillota bacterium]MCM1509277.1 endopeptidase La [Clostridium sp.]
MNENSQIQMIADYEGDIETLFDIQFDGIIPILATRNIVMFPGVICPILIGREQSVGLIDAMRANPNHIFAVFCQRNSDVEEPSKEDVYNVGVYAKLVKVIDLPGNQKTAIVQGLSRCVLEDFYRAASYFEGKVSPLPELLPKADDNEFSTAVRTLRRSMEEYIQKNDELPNESAFALQNISNNILITNFSATNLPIAITEKMDLLETQGTKERLFKLLRILSRELQFLDLKLNIQNKTHEDIDEQQREYFLHQQMRNIREELGGSEGSPEKKSLKDKAATKLWTEDVKKVFEREYDKLDNYNPQSPDYQIQLTYLQTFVSLPWGEKTIDNLDLKHAEKVLNSDHYAMEKVKERILEFLAVMKLRSMARQNNEDIKHKSQIICLFGPPGVGKTSLGKSIAKAIDRKYARISLGGMHDESEIRGHRRTYIGAMPGRIIKALQKVGSSNPVFILDEIDKVTQQTIHGDPTSALLEVLDPEQNSTFHDNYLDVDYDLSDVLFICTANDLGTIPRPLLDRMEVIELTGYTTEEKYEIAKRHLVKRDKQDNGFAGKTYKELKFDKKALLRIIEQYTRESGVRQLDRQINKVLRKLAVEMLTTGNIDTSPEKIQADDIEKYLGKPLVTRDIYQGNNYAGVVTGLAWTSVGGEILFIETSLSKGKAGKLTLTGNLGDVMKESAVLALEYCKAHSDLLNIDYRIFDNYNIHIHVPEGATPKDGPSAGITIATSIASALTQRKVRKNTAMTGEITLRGRVLPVGGIKEKILAAKRAGITDILLCNENKKDIEEIPEFYLTGVKFHYVENVKDVWDFALTDEKVDNAIEFTIETEKDKPRSAKD